MTTTSTHVSERIERPVDEVYAFAADPANLPQWASGLAHSDLQKDGDVWAVDSPMGRVTVEFAPRNDFGVLDHWVTLPSGERNYNPVRVIADGDVSEVVFSVRRFPGVSEDDYARDVNTVTTDLGTLKKVLEGR